jgi:hypothetical protein
MKRPQDGSKEPALGLPPLRNEGLFAGGRVSSLESHYYGSQRRSREHWCGRGPSSEVE